MIFSDWDDTLGNVAESEEDMIKQILKKYNCKDLEELEEEEHPDGKRVKRFKFKYVSDTAKGKVVIDCELIMTKMPKTDYYTVELVAKPKEEEISIVYIDQAAAVIKDIVMGWLKERKFHVG